VERDKLAVGNDRSRLRERGVTVLFNLDLRYRIWKGRRFIVKADALIQRCTRRIEELKHTDAKAAEIFSTLATSLAAVIASVRSAVAYYEFYLQVTKSHRKLLRATSHWGVRLDNVDMEQVKTWLDEQGK
jgi:hypothetical protein